MKLTTVGVLRINFRDFLPNDHRRIRCNYRCSYCNQRHVKEVAFTAGDYTEACQLWDKLGEIEDQLLVKANFDGEIFADDWAKRICFYIFGLPNVKRFEFITNNSVAPEVYMRYINPGKAVFNCSFHPDFISIDRFIAHIQQIKQYGCGVFATLIVTPQRIRQLESFITHFRNQSILLKPLLLLGRYQPNVPVALRRMHKNICNLFGIKTTFPQAYSKKVLGIIKEYYYSELEFEYQYGKKTQGELCSAGVTMINLYKDGTIMRCFRERLGSIDDLVAGRLRLARAPYPCPAATCQCPTHMIFLHSFQEQFQLHDDFVDHYYPKKEPGYAEKI